MLCSKTKYSTKCQAAFYFMWKDDGFLHDRLYRFAQQRGTDRACLHAGLFDPAADKLIFFILAVQCAFGK